MACHVVWDVLTQHQWSKHLQSAPFSAYQQQWHYGDVLQWLGGNVKRAAIYHDDTLIGVAQLQVRRYFNFFELGLVLRGPVWAPGLDPTVQANAYAKLKQTAPFGKASTLLMMPEYGDSAIGGTALRRIMTSYHTVLIDLSLSEDAFMAQLDGKWRNRLRAAQAANLDITLLPTAEQYEWLLQEESKQQQQRRYLSLPPAMVALYQEVAGSGSVMALKASLDGEPVAATLFLLHEHCATYHIGWSNEQGKQRNAHNLLMLEAFKRLKHKQIHTLDLGGVNTQDNEGLARFKLGMGGKVVSLPGTYL